MVLGKESEGRKQTNGWTEEWVDGQTDGRADIKKDRHSAFSSKEINKRLLVWRSLVLSYNYLVQNLIKLRRKSRHLRDTVRLLAIHVPA
jgi:hypothetical protein